MLRIKIEAIIKDYFKDKTTIFLKDIKFIEELNEYQIDIFKDWHIGLNVNDIVRHERDMKEYIDYLLEYEIKNILNKMYFKVSEGDNE